MKKEVNPFMMVGIIVLAVVALGLFAYKALQPTPYTPSPGAGGDASAARPGQPSTAAAPPTSNGNSYYPSAPPGSIPGKPPGR